MNTNILIDDRDLENAKNFCFGFYDETIGNRAVGANLASLAAEKFFAEAGLDVDIKTCLHNIEKFTKDLEISDIYVNGNYVDVRFYFDENEIYVPKAHFEKNILPVAYMFVRLQKDLYQADITGFLLPDTIAIVEDSTNKYYSVNENSLVPYEEIEYLFRDANDPFNVDNDEIYNAIDDDSIDTNFVKKLITSYEGRLRFCKAYTAQIILPQVDINQNIEAETNDSIEAFVDEPKMEDEGFSYDFSTSVSPNLPEETSEETLEDIISTNEGIIQPEESESVFDNFESDENTINEEIIEEIPTELPEETADSNVESEEIDTLFESEPGSDSEQELSYKQKKKSPILPILLVLLVLGAGGYYGYTKFAQQDTLSQSQLPQQMPIEQPKPEQTDDAMPIESVEKTAEPVAKEEGNSVSIPAIEQNLDASILVSNLRIDWEVPSGYVSNTQAKRYLVKLGKIIQLNLKTELLLLNRPPISNKISIELKYNPSSQTFETVGIVASSGEKTVDDLIMQTVQKALGAKLNISTESFGKLSGNPVIIIRL